MFEDILGKAADAISKGVKAVRNGAESVKKAQENSKIISDEHPLTTAGLEVYPNRLKYKNIHKPQVNPILKSRGDYGN